MTTEEEQLFQLLDNYSRGRYRCFLAEMSPNPANTEYILCFRPVTGAIHANDRYACRYLSIHISEARIASRAKALTTVVAGQLDKELATLGQAG